MLLEITAYWIEYILLSFTKNYVLILYLQVNKSEA
jgi:hypothetical protein